MDLSMLFHRFNQFKSLFASISDTKQNNKLSKTNPEILEIGRGIAFLIIALLCGWMSKTSSENTARQQLMLKEWPSSPVWLRVLKQGGWSPVANKDLSILLKNHPDPFSNQSIIWETEDHCLIFLTQSPYQNDRSEPELWSCATGHNKALKKVKWHKIGSGYSGVNLLAQISVQSVKKPASYIDPREIRY